MAAVLPPWSLPKKIQLLRPDGREEIEKPGNGMSGDAGENILEPGEWIDSGPLTGRYETPQYGCRLTALVTAKEDPVVAAYRLTADCAPWRCCRSVSLRPHSSVLAPASSSACSARPAPRDSSARFPPGFPLSSYATYPEWAAIGVGAILAGLPASGTVPASRNGIASALGKS